MSACPRIETQRLVLRPFREDDLDAYTAVLQAPEVRASLHSPDDIGREDAWLGMARWLGQWELRGTGQWAVEEKATGVSSGARACTSPSARTGPASVEYAFAHHDVDAIYSVILAENIASQAVARRLGFTPWEERVLSHLPDMPHVIWRLTRDEHDDGTTSTP